MRKIITFPGKSGSQQKKSWSHQHDLNALKGKEVSFKLNSGETIIGTILEADQFTVKIGKGTSMFSPIVLYKSSVTYFQAQA